MKLTGISSAGLGRIRRVISMKDSVITRLKEHEARQHFFRVQPVGAEVEGYQSTNYAGDGEIEGVWAFSSVFSLVRNLYDGMESYADQVMDDGEQPEIAVVSGDTGEEADDFVAVHQPHIVDRLSVESLMSEAEKHLDEDGDLSEGFLDSL